MFNWIKSTVQSAVSAVRNSYFNQIDDSETRVTANAALAMRSSVPTASNPVYAPIRQTYSQPIAPAVKPASLTLEAKLDEVEVGALGDLLNPVAETAHDLATQVQRSSTPTKQAQTESMEQYLGRKYLDNLSLEMDSELLKRNVYYLMQAPIMDAIKSRYGVSGMNYIAKELHKKAEILRQSYVDSRSSSEDIRIATNLMNNFKAVRDMYSSKAVTQPEHRIQSRVAVA